MTDIILEKIAAAYPLTELDVGDMASLKAHGMRFGVRAYRAEGLGHVSVMRASGFFGLMRMDTLIINPKDVDLPLYSYDRIYAMGNDTLIVELYDTTLTPFRDTALEAAKASYASLPERDPGEHWYDAIKLPSSISKKGKRSATPEFDKLALSHLEAYLATPADSVSDRALKGEKTSLYVEGLLQRGGPSTDVFKKSLGIDKCAELFRRHLFGTAD